MELNAVQPNFHCWLSVPDLTKLSQWYSIESVLGHRKCLNSNMFLFSWHNCTTVSVITATTKPPYDITQSWESTCASGTIWRSLIAHFANITASWARCTEEGKISIVHVHDNFSSSVRAVVHFFMQTTLAFDLGWKMTPDMTVSLDDDLSHQDSFFIHIAAKLFKHRLSVMVAYYLMCIVGMKYLLAAELRLLLGLVSA